MRPDDTTDLGRDRTILANERTYAAWIRTGLTSLGVGLAVERFMPGVAPPYSIRTIASLLILISFAAFFIASWRHINRNLSDVGAIPTWVTILISFALIVSALIAFVGIWSV